jgi:DNA-binding transcriptional ArsR family regulator
LSLIILLWQQLRRSPWSCARSPIRRGARSTNGSRRAGRVSQPAVSQHVKALQDAHLIVGRRDGRNVFYRADPRGLAPLAQWVQHYERIWAQSFDRLDDYLQTMQRNETNP